MVDNNGNGTSPSSGWRSFFRRESRSSELDLAPFRRLALQLNHDLSGPDAPRSALIVTPTRSLGSAHASTALARCLAEQLARPVLLIDASMRGAEISHMLGYHGQAGFADCLHDPDLSLDQMLLGTAQTNLSFLPAGVNGGPARPSPPDNIHPFLQAARQQSDFILFSGGSVLEDSMALNLAPHVGCVLLLATENETRLEDLDAARDALNYCKARKIGVVLTTTGRSKSWFA